MKEHRNRYYAIGMGAILLLLFASNLFFGSLSIPCKETLRILMGDETAKESWRFIILESRLPQALTALLSGAALSVSGLLLQTTFNNPLAGPSILGINTGASLGVALVMLLMGGSIGVGSLTFSGFLAVLIGAIIGALCVMFIILLFSSIVKGTLTLLIIGIMVGYIASSAISLLNFFATTEGVYSYMIWGLGSFSGVSLSQMPYFSGSILIGLIASLLLIKPLNALLLGERYAQNLGIHIKRSRNLLLTTVGLLSASTTAFCGPIAFIGLAVPHIARLLLGTSNHNTLLPFTILTGASVALLCNLACSLPGENGIIPLNAVTPIIGAPIIIYVLVHQHKIQYFN
ncbi:MAG: iron ABC transporter permease [Paludibacteraceae bacterium]|nr:iron ABC transporter permease [Paludibacteraceae bacterium]MBR4841379.1 iron ABC transporter permease [Paludibacteraceae bacterium]